MSLNGEWNRWSLNWFLTQAELICKNSRSFQGSLQDVLDLNFENSLHIVKFSVNMLLTSNDAQMSQSSPCCLLRQKEKVKIFFDRSRRKMEMAKNTLSIINSLSSLTFLLTFSSTFTIIFGSFRPNFLMPFICVMSVSGCRNSPLSKKQGHFVSTYECFLFPKQDQEMWKFCWFVFAQPRWKAVWWTKISVSFHLFSVFLKLGAD